MKFDAQKLLGAINICTKATKKNPTLAITEDLLIQKDKHGYVSVTGTTLHDTLVCRYKVEGKKELATLVDRVIAKALKGKTEIEILPDTENGELNLGFNDGSELKMTLDNYGDFPEINSTKDSFLTVFDSSFIDKIKRLMPLVTTDEMRPAMTGVALNGSAEKNQVVMCASDGHVLKRIILDQDVKIDFQIVLTVATAKILTQLNLTPPIYLFKGVGKYFVLETGNDDYEINLVFRPIEQTYPNFNAVIPHDNPNSFSVDRKKFIEKLKEVNEWTNKTTNQAVIDLAERKLIAQDLDFRHKYSTTFECEHINGSPAKAHVNCSFLIKLLNTITTKEIEFTYKVYEGNDSSLMGTVTKPITINDVGELSLIMPVVIY